MAGPRSPKGTSAHSVLALAALIRGETIVDPNWEHLAAVAGPHGVSALLHAALPPNGVPPAIRSALGTRRADAAARSAAGRWQRDALLAAFHAADLPVLVLKGGAMAATWYSDPTLRPIRDLDLLVPVQDHTRAIELLRGLDYTVATEHGAEHHIVLRHSLWPLPVELHRTLGDPGARLAPAGLWTRAAVVRDGEASVPTLGPEDTLLHLCLHLLRHMQGNGGWHLRALCDLDRHLATVPLDWDVAADRLHLLGLTGAVGAVLDLTARVVPAAPVPPGFRHPAGARLLALPLIVPASPRTPLLRGLGRFTTALGTGNAPALRRTLTTRPQHDTRRRRLMAGIGAACRRPIATGRDLTATLWTAAAAIRATRRTRRILSDLLPPPPAELQPSPAPPHGDQPG